MIYIIPGWGESCGEARYKKLGSILEHKGYVVERVKADWNTTLSANVFKPQSNSVLIGFSFGAVVCYLIAKKYPSKKVIFCSLSPLKVITYEEIYKEAIKHLNHDLSVAVAKDVKSIKISLKDLKVQYITLAGEKEKLCKGEFLVPKSDHFITNNYINCISKLV